ncbi:MAG: transposase [Pseudorhodobacter sp.]|jgi:transposase
MTSLVRQIKSHPERTSKWLASLLERKPARVATVALANKTVRIVWAVLTRNHPRIESIAAVHAAA